ncbi:hypothetical protein SLPG_00051 [Salicola phage CGphi29]|uniref:hypothetical protein n=1 Tax=Salicola phage CGphi29 TaxID=754067 RepID=UPI0002C08010|nr:hypothetical protein SLPG_00051 [Salicola phage CGphi29]AGH31845.1 hypothetical protein SLPG_00051 [Salicola phage CGphi29]
MTDAKELICQIEIENGIIKRLSRGESVRVGKATIDDQTVIDTMYGLDPDRYCKAIRTLATGSASEAESALETMRRMWDYALASVMQEYSEAIEDQAKREANNANDTV